MPDKHSDIAARAIESLSVAVAVARAGDRERAREMCAAVLFSVQPILGRHKPLLRVLMHALLTAHGFKLLSRLVQAMSGRRLHVMLTADGCGGVRLPVCYEESRDVNCTIDARWLACLDEDDPYLRRWCASLAAGRSAPANRRVPVNAKEPV